MGDKKDRTRPNWKVYKAGLVLFITLLVGIAIIGKGLSVQIKEGDELMKLAERQQYRYEVSEATRGNIITENGELLATSVPIYDVYYDPLAEAIRDDSVFNKNIGALSSTLAKLFPQRTEKGWADYITKNRKAKNSYVPIAKKVPLEYYNTLLEVGKPKKEKRAFSKGFTCKKSMSRITPYGSLAFRTIGYVNEKDADSTKHVYVGLEGAYNDRLKGKNGRQLVRIVAKGGRQPVKSDQNRLGENGLDVITTIDVCLQDIAETTLRKRLALHKAEQGCVIIMDVKTGYVKAITSLQYNAEKDTCTESYNFAINGNYEPGSVFKLASILAYLDENPNVDIDKQDIRIGTGAPMTFGSKPMSDDHVINKETGIVSIRQIIEQSSNIGTAKLITDQFGKKQDKFIKKLHAMNIGEKLGLDIAGESTPRVSISAGDKAALSRISIGYAVTVAPIHLITFYNAIANDGKMMKPQFVKEIRKANTVVEEFKPVVINKQIASPRSIALAKSMMEGVVQNGTAKSLKNTPFLIAGKTGTARTISNGTYNKPYNTTFAGYFPADNPKYSCIVVISKAQDRSHGWAASQVAAPAFKDIVEKVYAIRLGIETDSTTTIGEANNITKGTMALDDARQMLNKACPKYYDTLQSSDKDRWVRVTENSENGCISIDAADNSTDLIPNFIGMSISDAIYIAENMGVKVSFSGCGNVKSQSINAGTKATKGMTIELKLGV